MLAFLLTGFGKSLIYQFGLLGIVLSGFDPVTRHDSAVFVVFLLSSDSNERAVIHVRSVFIRLLLPTSYLLICSTLKRSPP